jgi:hypothetical protein
MESNKNKVLDNLSSGKVDGDDIKTILFDIFSSRQKFNFSLKERFFLYLGPLKTFLKCCFPKLKEKVEMYKKGEARYYKDLDIL